MLEGLEEIAIPTWLSSLSASTIRDASLPLHEILQHSLYYPSSGFDGDPVKHLAGNILSFVYVDNGRRQEELEDALRNPGFRGYDIIGSRDVTERELTPRGWSPSFPSPADGDPLRYRGWMRTPFCSWTAMQRRDDVPSSHGPARFSFLYLCADGVAAFQALYVANHEAPKAVAVIQPGHGFGGNWTNFGSPNLIFARSVLGNSAGPPELLLYGGIGRRDFYCNPCWPDYGQQICFLAKAGGGTIGVWRRDAPSREKTFFVCRALE